MTFSRLKNRLLVALMIVAALPAVASANLYCGDGILGGDEQCDDGNFENRDGCSSYCKIEDMTPPEVVSVSIPDKTEGVSTLTDTLSVMFSEPIDPASLIKNVTVRFEHAAEPMPFDFGLEDDQKTLTIHIGGDLFSESVHALRLTRIRDIAGNTMEGTVNGEYISVFTTAVATDNTAPTLVVDPPSGIYHFPQQLFIRAYVSDYTGSDEFLDETAQIYYSLDNPNVSAKSQKYTGPISVDENKTLRYFAIDGAGNATPVLTEAYSFACPDVPHAKKTISNYPECKVLECNIGFVLRGNLCAQQLGEGDPDDYRANAVTAPLLPSSTPMTIRSKPAIYVTPEHKGVLPRPLVFVDSKRGTVVHFEQNTKITNESGEPFTGYIKPPQNRYLKDFPIEFGYSFRSIVEFRDVEGHDLMFDPPIQITLPFSEAFNPDEEASVLTLNPVTLQYSEFPRNLYSTDLEKKEVTIKSRTTQLFFVAQSGKNFNRSIFSDVATHWAKNYIEMLYRKGIVKGRAKDIFAPNDPLTRAEFVKIALSATETEIESPDDIDETYFEDVPLYAWYAPYIKKAFEMSLISGYSDGAFHPDQPITRAETIKMIFLAFKFDIDDRLASGTTETRKRFVDLRGNPWYFPFADFAIQKKILSGVQDGNNPDISFFGPANPITRGEMAKLTVKTMELAEKMDKKSGK